MSDAIREKAERLALYSSSLDMEMMARGTGLEDAVKIAIARGDKKLLAKHIATLLLHQPEREAAAKVRAAMLESPSAVFLLDAVVRLMLAPATTPDELRDAAQRIEETLSKLK